ncbi:hypothetical protein HYS48_02095 [Candidatus Woesearchaeota archaeon]|nr:hypothetical protein [Candidatus Woesearchaeota archaeon]
MKNVCSLLLLLIFIVSCTPEELLLGELPAEKEDISYVDVEKALEAGEEQKPAQEEMPEEPETAIEVEEEIAIEPEEPEQGVGVEEQAIAETKEEYDKLITVEEGQLVKIPVRARDPDGDEVKLKFSKPLNENGEWQTKEGDAGEYMATITASDGKMTVEKKVKIVVTELNEPPRIKPIPDVTIKVGDTIRFEPETEDPNGDEVTIAYSGWMTNAEYKATKDDIGEHEVIITASDGKLKDKKFVKVTVVARNDPPVIEPMADITVSEGDTIKLQPKVKDPNGDEVKITYSGWMAKDTYTTNFEDEGVHEVIITASDGELAAVEKITITVKDRNRAPNISIELP